jgi:hypothetical protein
MSEQKFIILIVNSLEFTDILTDAVIPMKAEGAKLEESFLVPNSSSLDDATQEIKKNLYVKYDAADLNQIVNKCSQLTSLQKNNLFTLLTKYSTLFDGTLGIWKDEPYKIELKPDTTPYHARTFAIPKFHENTLKMEIQRLCD